jgi:hypothetical protein
MKQILVGSFIICLTLYAPLAQATTVHETIITKPYEIIKLESDLDTEQYWLGELVGDPVLYEVEVQSTTTLSAVLRQKYTDEKPIPFAFLLVMKDVNRGGVSEVIRLKSSESDWTKVKDTQFAVDFLESRRVNEVVSPGTYRIEVSTPVNEGKFLLVVGNKEPSSGYFETISNVAKVQGHFGYSSLAFVFSSYVLYPLGIVILLGLIYATWMYRRKIAHVD